MIPATFRYLDQASWNAEIDSVSLSLILNEGPQKRPFFLVLFVPMKTKIVLGLLFTLGCLSFTAQGQILNIERHRLKDDTAKAFIANVRFGLNLNNRSAAEDAPVNLFGVNSAVNALYRTEHHGYILVGQTDYLKINDNTFLNFGFLHFRVNLLRDRRFNYEVFSQASYDNFRGLDPRLVAGGGVRYKLVEQERSDIILGMGAFYENERWLHPFTEQLVQVDFLKFSSYVSFRQDIAENIDFNTVVYYQTTWDQGISALRNRLSGAINLNSKLTKKLALNNNFEFSYEDQPIVPITKFIYSLRVGLQYNF